jgi:hypothetical protein
MSNKKATNGTGWIGRWSLFLPIAKMELMALMSREMMVLSSCSGQLTAPETLVPEPKCDSELYL